MIDLESLNPDWQQAKDHGKASRPGRHNAKGDICACCMNSIQKQQVFLSENSKSLEFLGYGFPLYFIFIKYCLILLLMLIITYTSIGIYWATVNNYNFCIENISFEESNGHVVVCTSWMVFLSRIQQKVSCDQQILRITSFIAQLLILVYIRDILKKTHQYYDQRQISPSDFSIFVENLPKTKGMCINLQAFLNDQKAFQKPHKIESFIYINELDIYFKLKRDKTVLIEKLKNLKKNQNKYKNEEYNSLLQVIEKQISKIKKQILDQENKEKLNMNKDETQCEKMIIIVNTEEEKQQIMQDFDNLTEQKKRQYFGNNSEIVSFTEAPQPRQILWENINLPRADHIKRVIISWIWYVFVLACITGLFFVLMSTKSNYVEHNSETSDTHHQGTSSIQSTSSIQKTGIIISLVYGSLLLIILFNKFILAVVCQKLTEYQKQKTGGAYQFSFALKNVLGLFFTTAIMTLLVEDLNFHNIYSFAYGVIEQETIMFLMNAFLVPLIWFINPWYLAKKLIREYSYGKQLMTQLQANKIMQEPHYSIGKRYSQIIQSLWFTYLYASLIPLGSCAIFIGICLFYWIDKYNLLRKSSVLENVSSHISMKAMMLLDFTLILRPLGQILFDCQIRDSFTMSSIICSIVGFAYICLPVNDILTYFHPEEFNLADQTYTETKELFLFDYHTLHPLRQRQSRLNTLRNLTRKQSQQKKLSESQEKAEIQLTNILNIIIKNVSGSNHPIRRQSGSKIIKRDSQIKESIFRNTQNQPLTDQLSGTGIMRGKILPSLKFHRKMEFINPI